MKKSMLFLVVVPLAVGFVVACLWLWLRNGRSPLMTRVKMKLGALLLTITGIAACNGGGGQVMCYETAPLNMVRVNETNDRGSVEFLEGDTFKVTGTILGAQDKAYSYALVDASGNTVVQDVLMKRDSAGMYDNPDFTILFDVTTPSGTYTLEFFRSEIPADSVSLNQDVEIKIWK